RQPPTSSSENDHKNAPRSTPGPSPREQGRTRLGNNGAVADFDLLCAALVSAPKTQSKVSSRTFRRSGTTKPDRRRPDTIYACTARRSLRASPTWLTVCTYSRLLIKCLLTVTG